MTRLNFGHPSNRGLMAFYDIQNQKNAIDIKDSSGGNHTATGINISSTDWVLSNGSDGGNSYGYTLSFDGSTAYLEANNINLESSGQFTNQVAISMWVLPSSIDGTIVKQYEGDFVGDLDGSTQYYNTTNTGFLLGGDRCIAKEDAGNNALRITTSTLSGLSPTGDYSISMWTYDNPATTVRDKVQMSIWGSTSGERQFKLYLDTSSNLQFDFSETSGNTNKIVNLSGPAILAGRWYHTIVTFQKSIQLAKVYVDGAVAVSGAGTYVGSGISQTGQAEFWIGNIEDTATNPTGTFDGRIAPCSVWNKLLSEAEITTLYNSGNQAVLFSGYTGILTTDLEAHWDMTGLAGSVRQDLTTSGADHFLTETGGTLNNSLGFSNHKSFTCISTWNLDTKTTDKSIVANYDGTNENRQWNHFIDVSDAGQIELRVNSHGATGLLRADGSFPIHETGINYGTTPAPTSEWVFSVCGYDAPNDNLFLDVNNSGQQTLQWKNGIFSSGTISNFTIGAVNPSGSIQDHFDGGQTQVAFWDRVLTTGETNYIYNSGKTLGYGKIGITGTVGSGLKTGLIAWYKLHDINDSHTNNYTLTNNGTIIFDRLGNSDDNLKVYKIGLKSPSGIIFGINDNEYVFSGVIDNSNWHHVLASFNGDLSGTLSGQNIFVDGEEKIGVLLSGVDQTSLNNSTSITTIAKQQNISTNHYSGRIRNIRIYNRAFGLTDVKQLYTLEKK